jgi:subtilisin family serine protease
MGKTAIQIIFVVLMTLLANAQTLNTDFIIAPNLKAKIRAQDPELSRRPVIVVHSRPKPSCVGRVCLVDHATLSQQKDIESMHWPTRYYMRLAHSGVLMDLPQARSEFELYGQGVLIAVIDTGVDWTHPDFIDSHGRTRVAWLLDQAQGSSGRYPELESIGRGAVYSSDDLQQVLDNNFGPAEGAGKDEIGHGTHVAGIALGDDQTYLGVAPKARLIAVKAIDQDTVGFAEDKILSAIAFAYQVAVREYQPLVINLSIGNQMGAHDGTLPLELALDDLVTNSNYPPVAVVVAAGNEGNLEQHVRAAVSDNEPPVKFELMVPPSFFQNPDQPASISLDFWESDSRAMTVDVISPSGAETGPVTSDGPYIQSAATTDGEIEITRTKRPWPYNNKQQTTVNLKASHQNKLATGIWTIRFSGKAARIDGWVGQAELSGIGTPRFLNHLDATNLVGPPATAKHVIAVGGFVSHNQWTDISENRHTTPQVVGEMVQSSSPGPTSDGRLKPELTAPGMNVGSTLSKYAYPTLSDVSMFYLGGSKQLILSDGLHAIASGTSMAAPMVAGLAALLFEKDSSLSGTRIRQLLMMSTKTDQATGYGEVYNPFWGFGKANAFRAIAASQQLGGSFDRQQSFCGVSQPWLPPEESILTVCLPRDKNGLPLGPGLNVSIEASGTGFSGPLIDNGSGFYYRLLHGNGRPHSNAQISCSLDGIKTDASPKVLMAASYQEFASQDSDGGGCQCGNTDQPSWLLFILGTIFLTLRTRTTRATRTRGRTTGTR